MNAYIIKGFRSAVGKAPKGAFRFMRADDLAADVVKHLVQNIPNLTPELIDDVIVGCATPEAEQGLNLGRMVSLLGLNTDKVPGMTVNRYCASGLEAIAIANAKIKAGMAHCIVAGGAEIMSGMPWGGWKVVPNYQLVQQHPDYYWSMGLTAEAVAKEYHISREAQDTFAFHSHQKAINALKSGKFKQEIAPITINEVYLDEQERRKNRTFTIDNDEGPRSDTSIDKLSTLKPVFAAQGSVTAGNSSQTSDGAAFVLVVSEQMLKQLNIEPDGQMLSYAVAGVPPRIMGIGPVEAIPKALNLAGLKQNDIGLMELNEAFASQALAVTDTLKINPDVVNVNGGAIALGHPLGCTGAKLSVQLLHELQRTKKKYGIVTMCVGTGQGAAAVFESFKS